METLISSWFLTIISRDGLFFILFALHVRICIISVAVYIYLLFEYGSFFLSCFRYSCSLSTSLFFCFTVFASQGKVHGKEPFTGLNFNNANQSQRPGAARPYTVRKNTVYNLGEEETEEESESDGESKYTITKETLLQGSRRGVIRSDDIMITWETQDSDYLKVELYNGIPKYESTKKVCLPNISRRKFERYIEQVQPVKENNHEPLPPIEKSENKNSSPSNLSLKIISSEEMRPTRRVYDSTFTPYMTRDTMSKFGNMLARTPAEEYFEKLKRQIKRKGAYYLHKKKSITDSRHLQQSIKMFTKYHQTVYGLKVSDGVKLPKTFKPSIRNRKQKNSKLRTEKTSPYQCNTAGNKKIGKAYCIKCDRKCCTCVTLPSHILNPGKLHRRQDRVASHKGAFRKS